MSCAASLSSRTCGCGSAASAPSHEIPLIQIDRGTRPLAAIPAAIFYNYFGYLIRELGARMDDFSLEFLNLAERTFGGE